MLGLDAFKEFGRFGRIEVVSIDIVEQGQQVFGLRFALDEAFDVEVIGDAVFSSDGDELLIGVAVALADLLTGLVFQFIKLRFERLTELDINAEVVEGRFILHDFRDGTDIFEVGTI